MANNGFNGTTCNFANATVGAIRSVSYQSSGAKVEVTGSNAATKHFVAGIPDNTLNVTVVGTSNTTVGTIGTLVVAWFDGGSTNFGNAVCTAVGTSGDEDGAITSTLAFAPAD